MLLGPLALVSIQALGETPRLSYTESCAFLQKRGYLEEGPIPPLPNRVPQYDDPEPLGLSFFRTRLDHDRLENLTLRRTFFGRSEIVDVSFRHTDLSESNLCWNDFIEVDFSHAILKSADLRASAFVNVRFDRADLTKRTFAAPRSRAVPSTMQISGRLSPFIGNGRR